MFRLKKKQKRSASSSPSSSSARSSSSSSSASSSRRRSKKKKKKKQKKSEQASRRHRRVSSRESRRSEEDKNKRDGREEEEEEEEEEWYPVPSDTSATFLNRKEGPGLKEEVGERRISLCSLSDEDGSDSLDKGRKRRDKEQEKRKSGRKSLSRSPEKGERLNRGKEENRRSSTEENSRRRTSCCSSEDQNSQKVNISWSEGRRQERWNSSEGGRYKNSGWQEHPDERVEKDGRREQAEGESSRAGAGSSSRSEGPGGSWTAAGRPGKALPSNLLDIFSQIAQFEKEKGIKPK